MSFPSNPGVYRPKARAAYYYDANHEQRLLSIIDQDHVGVPSVTNDIRNVLADITQEEGLTSLAGYGVTYRDTEGDWCRVVIQADGSFGQICSFGLRVTDEAEALRRLQALQAA